VKIKGNFHLQTFTKMNKDLIVFKMVKKNIQTYLILELAEPSHCRKYKFTFSLPGI